MLHLWYSAKRAENLKLGATINIYSNICNMIPGHGAYMLLAMFLLSGR